jgi:hypothetical protein
MRHGTAPIDAIKCNAMIDSKIQESGETDSRCWDKQCEKVVITQPSQLPTLAMERWSLNRKCDRKHFK